MSEPLSPPPTPPGQPPSRARSGFPHVLIRTWPGRIGLGCAGLLVASCACTGVLAVLGAPLGSTQSTTTTATHTASAIHATPGATATRTLVGQSSPTATMGAVSLQPTATTSTSAGPAILGAPDSAFIARYGQPNSHSDPSSGTLHFESYGANEPDAVIIMTDIIDGGSYAHRVMMVTLQAPPSGWTSSQAQSICQAAAPFDAQKKQRIDVSSVDGAGSFDEIEQSASLATLFPASAFTDAQRNAAKPGSFDILYLGAKSGGLDNCELLLGTQQSAG